MPVTAIENQGGFSLLRSLDGQAFVQTGSNTLPQAITFSGNSVGAGDGNSPWQMIAAENDGGINKALWRYNPTGDLHVWRLNSDWQWTSSEPGLIKVNTAQGWALESAFGVDADGNGFVGMPVTAIENQIFSLRYQHDNLDYKANVVVAEYSVILLGTKENLGGEAIDL